MQGRFQFSRNEKTLVLDKTRTPRRKAVPLSRQSSARILVAFKPSSMLLPAAITAQTMAPADEPANGVVSCMIQNSDVYMSPNMSEHHYFKIIHRLVILGQFSLQSQHGG